MLIKVREMTLVSKASSSNRAVNADMLRFRKIATYCVAMR